MNFLLSQAPSALYLVVNYVIDIIAIDAISY